MRVLRVFPRRTNATPDDDLAVVGEPGLFRPEADEVHVSCAFTWDIPEANRLAHAWSAFYPIVRRGGPAYGSTPGEFTPGLYMGPGYTITSRGCPNRCPLCFVPGREGPLRVIEIKPGWDVCDNNLLACPRSHVEAVLDMLEGQPKAARFTGGLEACRVTRWFVNRLARMRLDVAYFALDDWEHRDHVATAIAMLRAAGGWSDGTARHKIGVYVLVGYPGDDVESAEIRLRFVMGLGARAFPMYYRGLDSSASRPREWRDLVGRMITAFRV